MRGIELRPLLSIEVAVQPVVELRVDRRFVSFSGGRFVGRDDLEGKVLNGGTDWQQVRADGTFEIDAHYVLMTDSGEFIEVRSSGLRRVSPEVNERIMGGEAVDPESYYFRTHVRLQTSAPKLEWLNDLIALSTGHRERDVVHIDVHEVL